MVAEWQHAVSGVANDPPARRCTRERRSSRTPVLARTRCIHMLGMERLCQRMEDVLVRWTHALPAEAPNVEALCRLKENLSPRQQDQLELFNSRVVTKSASRLFIPQDLTL
jgi:hypothetical protein